MTRARHERCRVALAVALLLAPVACRNDARTGAPPGTTMSDSVGAAPTSPTSMLEQAPTPSPLLDRPLPAPIAVRDTPEGVTLADASFTALPGATAERGELGGATYQIEVPDHWTGRLVLWMHGYGELAREAHVGPPDFRRRLLASGTAWAASSFSSTSLIPGRAADETAALWDRFVQLHGRPRRTYVTGMSMGGWATHLAAERYGDRYDGALALCGAAGTNAGVRIAVDQFVAGAYVAGVDQRELDAANPQVIVDTRLRPALLDPRARARFEAIMIGMTGGPRPFDREGLRDEEETNWKRAEQLITAGLAPDHEGAYSFASGTDVAVDDFNARALHFALNAEAYQWFTAGTDTTGRLVMPLVTLHTTGDGQVPIEQAEILHDRVAAAGAGDHLVQRVVRDPGHCGFTTSEVEDALEGLVGWTEQGRVPDGTNLATRDLTRLDRTFDRQPRPGTPEADRVPGASQRIHVRGHATVDGAPFQARWIGATVRTDGLETPCQYALVPVEAGAYDLTVMADAEAAGCGHPGAELLVWTYVGDQQLWSTIAVPWPGGRETTFDATFATATPDGDSRPMTGLAGEVYRPDGQHADPGVRIEAFVGDTRCGVSSTRRVGSYLGFSMSVAGPASRPGCVDGATVRFTVDGVTVPETLTNGDASQRELDLTQP